MPDFALDDLSTLVQQQVEDILRQRPDRFSPEYQDRFETLEAQVGKILDSSRLGRAMTGPVWFDGASIVNGTINADKLVVNSLDAITVNSGDLNVTGSLTAAAAFPATGARIVLNSSALAAYNASSTQTIGINVDGSGFIGTGANKITWTTAGVVTVPAAIIGSLTIANVGSGNLGGSYTTGSSNPKITFSASKIEATNSGGTVTFLLDATTGAMTATGSFTIKSSASGARVVIDNAGGVEGFNASNVSTFRLNAATGEGYVGGTGSGTNGISWNSSGTVSIGGASFSSGKITASSLSISSLSAISADLGTITAGTISGGTISAGTITTGTLAADRVSGGSLGGGINLGTAGISINSSGTISNSDGDTWSSTGITLVSAGTFGDAIKWKVSGSDVFSIWAASNVVSLGMTSGGQLVMGNAAGGGTSSSTFLEIRDTVGHVFGGKLFPGNGTGGNNQSSAILEGFGGSPFYLKGTCDYLHVTGSASYAGLKFDNIANGGSASAWSSFGTANIPDKAAGYFKINIGGTNYRVAFYADS